MGDERPKLTVLYPLADEHEDDQPGTVETKGPCRHREVRLDPDARRVFCQKCDAEVDAFSVVLRWAQDWDRVRAWHKEAIRRCDRARDRLDEILRLERNARARLRNLDPVEAAKAPGKPWGEGMPL